MNRLCFLLVLCLSVSGSLAQQAYYFPEVSGFDSDIPSPEAFLGYEIGSHHTRHDRIVAYFQELAERSDRASFQQIGETHEHRIQMILTITHPRHHGRLEEIRQQHLNWCNLDQDVKQSSEVPILVHLGYNVHGNEPSGSEAAMLTAYYLVAGQGEEADQFRDEAVVFIDPVINPDGRDRHTHWANMHKGAPMVSDPIDREHNEVWPGGRTNHFWFDLNRDWILLVHPELQNKLQWYHRWLPNVTTDFHEMGTNSSHFFEPMKVNGSKDPIMPDENVTVLNERFAGYFSEALDDIGSLYFTKEVFDGTYPGYGSSYPDLQGGLGLLFEQASSRGHLQLTETGRELTFGFTIRNQLTSSLATLRAAVNEKSLLQNYQRDFFASALTNAKKDPVKFYVFGDAYDHSRNRAFLHLLLQHQVEVYTLESDVNLDGKTFAKTSSWAVPTEQLQYRMVQTMFETYEEYHDSVFYDASAWSLANSYGLAYAASSRPVSTGERLTPEMIATPDPAPFEQSEYAYIMEWEDYYAPAALYAMQREGVVVHSAFQPFKIADKEFGYGSLMIPVQTQSFQSQTVYQILKKVAARFPVRFHTLTSGYSQQGVDLGSRWLQPLDQPRALMLVGEGVRGYEAGEVWHLLDTRMQMPITKVDMTDVRRIRWTDYNVVVLVSGYYRLDKQVLEELKEWVSDGGTLITIREASAWAIRERLVREKLIEEEQDSTPVVRKPYVLANEISGAQQLGGAIFNVDLDLTHPLAFGYHASSLPTYKSSTIYLEPSKSAFNTVAQYQDKPHVDGFISDENLNLLKNSAAVLVSQVGNGRVVLFADNPNFRGTWYGTNRLFLNALFLGSKIRVPD
ncbi:MAG: M14 family zinc carboxypeptidase [Bacteroidota bacterium]